MGRAVMKGKRKRVVGGFVWRGGEKSTSCDVDCCGMQEERTCAGQQREQTDKTGRERKRGPKTKTRQQEFYFRRDAVRLF